MLQATHLVLFVVALLVLLPVRSEARAGKLAKRHIPSRSLPREHNTDIDVLQIHPEFAGFYGGPNAQALKTGLPLPRPRSIVRCPPGGCNETFWAERAERELARRAAPSPTTLPALSGSFQETCSSITYTWSGSLSTVNAKCLDQTGVLRTTSLSIDSCIGNNYGSMQCYLPLNLFWGSTCRSCSVSGTIMTCSCNKGNGLYQTTSTDLSQCFGNNNGALYCNAHKP